MKLGKGKLVHDPEKGFAITGHYNGKDYKIERKPNSMYGLHIEYDYCYIKPEDCVDISTDKGSLYCYPMNKKNVVTKLSLATEELFRINAEKAAAEKAQRRAARKAKSDEE